MLWHNSILSEELIGMHKNSQFPRFSNMPSNTLTSDLGQVYLLQSANL